MYISKRVGFTLAEVLIALTIVGVVAAMTLPPLITNIQSQVKAKRVQNIKQKFSKATDKMLAMSGMNGYGTTENFVEELKNHLKIAKVCDNEHLSECWGYDKVGLKDGKVWEVAKTKTGKTLKMTDSETEEWSSTVGIVTADGTSMILSYNKKCDMTTNVSPQWTSDQSTSTNCIAAVFDYNGGTKPNMFDHSDKKHLAKSDIIAFNAGGLGQDCLVELNGKCFTKVVNPTYSEAYNLTQNWCYNLPESSLGGIRFPGSPAPGPEGEAKDLGITSCRSKQNYYYAAVKGCGHVNNMLSDQDIRKLADLIYETNEISSDSYMGFYDGNANSEIATSLGLPDPNVGSGFCVFTRDGGDICFKSKSFGISIMPPYGDIAGGVGYTIPSESYAITLCSE